MIAKITMPKSEEEQQEVLDILGRMAEHLDICSECSRGSLMDYPRYCRTGMTFLIDLGRITNLKTYDSNPSAN